MRHVLAPCSILALLTLAAGGGTLAGCGLDETPADFSFLNLEPETIDPGRVSGQAGGRIALNLFEGLTYRHPETLEPVPGMARSWDLSPDGRTYVFHLRPALWSDGTRVTSHDFQYAWTRLLDPATGAKYANILYSIENARAFNAGDLDDPARLGMRCPDDSTFVVQLEAPVAYFLDLCAFYSLLPVPRQSVKAHGDAWIRPENIVTNGAFLLEDWQINRRMRLRRNPRYWNATSVQLNVVDAMPGDYLNGSFNRYMSGILDWIDSSGIPLTIVDQLVDRPDFHTAPLFATYFYRFNVTRPPLDDARVRLALYHAVDAQAIVQHVLRAGQPAAHSLVPPGLPGYQEVRLTGYQPDLARALLTQAGYPGGEGFPRISLLFNTSEANKQIAEVIQQQWKDVLGIEVELHNQEWKVFMATVQSLDYDIGRGGWIGDYLDPNTFLECFVSGSGNNRTGFASAAYDSLVQLAAVTVDRTRRMEILHRCEEIVTEQECILLPIYYHVVTNMFDGTRWGGLQPTLINAVDLKAVTRKDRPS
jgi:oligopeptide transport system substrate-binding protein